MEEFVEPPSSIQKLRPNTQKLKIVELPSSIPCILDLDFQFHHRIWSLCFSFSICLAILCLPGFVVLFLCWLIKEYKDKREKKRVSKKERKNNKNEKIKNIIFNI
jgi:ABC-type protease/lipase transport system fused ATPase/permease subunit